MNSLFKSIPLIGLLLFGLWSCSLEDVAPHKQVTFVDPLPLAKEFYEAEKPRQVNSSFRIQAEQEVFPFWAGAKSHADGRILIVPAHRKLQVRYEAGYLRRFVFELDDRGQVLRGGMLEFSGKDSKFLLQNEALLIEGFLSGVKSKDLTYLWSDFVAIPLDGTQADGRVVALQREGGGKSRLDAEALRTEFCIDWYWVYSFNGVVVFEVYSHTTCGSASCDSARTANAQDACLDDGTGSGGDGVEQKQMNCSELRNNHNEPINDQWAFRNANYGKTYQEIISQRANNSWTFINSQQGGPSIRYISDPLNPNIIIDLRHLFIVGELGRAAGESIEIMQSITNNPSGYDDQDFYSNELGYYFFQNFGEAVKNNPTATADYLITFLNNPIFRNSTSSPERSK